MVAHALAIVENVADLLNIWDRAFDQGIELVLVVRKEIDTTEAFQLGVRWPS